MLPATGLGKGVLNWSWLFMLVLASALLTLRAVRQDCHPLYQVSATPREPSLSEGAIVTPDEVAALRAARRSQRITYNALARRTGLSLRYLVEIEHGLRVPHANDAACICKVLAGKDGQD